MGWLSSLTSTKVHSWDKMHYIILKKKKKRTEINFFFSSKSFFYVYIGRTMIQGRNTPETLPADCLLYDVVAVETCRGEEPVVFFRWRISKFRDSKSELMARFLATMNFTTPAVLLDIAVRQGRSTLKFRTTWRKGVFSAPCIRCTLILSRVSTAAASYR